jgi:ribosomal protein S18 acetylase RimI-like enzyme
MTPERGPLAIPVVRPLRGDEGDWLKATVAERWPHELLVGRGRVREISELSALVAVDADARVGLLTYVVEGDVVELVTLDALQPGLGAGAALIAALAAWASSAGVRRIVAMVTNDNVRGLRYYQRLGFRLSQLRPGAMDALRAHKAWIPTTGQDSIPVRDEIELVLSLPATGGAGQADPAQL